MNDMSTAGIIPAQTTIETSADAARRLVEALPAHVRIGYVKFRIERWNAVSSAASRRYGECSHVEQTIRISVSSGSPQKVVDTFIHECLHAIYVVFNIHDEDVEERTCGTMSVGLTSLFLDNPWLTGWIEKGLRDDAAGL